MMGRRAAMGGILMIGARLITRVFDLATVLVLARILQPTDFGLVAIAMTLVSIIEAALELPVNQALLHLSDITPRQYDTAFTLSVLRGVVLTTILILAAWPFAGFYGDHRLTLLIWVLALGPVSRGLVSPRLAEFQKKMSFWRDFVIELSGKLAGFSVAVGAAFWTQSYWSIVASSVGYPLTMAVTSYIFAPYRPRLSLSEARIFTGFVGWMTGAQILGALNWQFERLLLGKLQTTSGLGLFTTANDLASIPMLAIFGPILRPLLAAFTHLRHERDKLARSYQSAAIAVLTVGVPLLVGESLVAEPLVLLLLGEKWRGAIPLLRGLALSLVPNLFGVPAISLMMSFGRTKVVLRRNLLEVCVKMPLVVLGATTFGFMGIVFARLAAETASAVFSMNVVRTLTGLSIRSQIAASWRAMISTAAMAVPVLLCLRYLPADKGSATAAVNLAVTVVLGAATYAAVLSWLWTLAGRPAGVEAMALGAFGRLSSRLR